MIEHVRAQNWTAIALVEWRSYAFDQVSRSSEHHRFVVEDHLVYDLNRTYDDRFLGHFFGVELDIEALCREPGSRSAVSAISTLTEERYRAYLPILELYRAFLPLVERELRDRWGSSSPRSFRAVPLRQFSSECGYGFRSRDQQRAD